MSACCTAIVGPIDLREGEILLHAVGLINYRDIMEGRTRPVSKRTFTSGELDYIRWDPLEEWLLLRQVWKNGGGDCDDVAPALAASMWAAGHWNAHSVILPPRNRVAHVVVKYNGHTLDPSLWGGMGSLMEHIDFQEGRLGALHEQALRRIVRHGGRPSEIRDVLKMAQMSRRARRPFGLDVIT